MFLAEHILKFNNSKRAQKSLVWSYGRKVGFLSGQVTKELVNSVLLTPQCLTWKTFSFFEN